MAKKAGEPKYSEKDRLEIVKGICDNYATGDFTIASCCAASVISERTFNTWLKDDKEEHENKESTADLADLYKKAKKEAANVYKGSLKEKARTSLEILVEGQTVTEKEVHSGILGTKTVTKTKVILPNTTAVIFALTNVDGENFAHKQEMKHSGAISVSDTKFSLKTKG